MLHFVRRTVCTQKTAFENLLKETLNKQQSSLMQVFRNRGVNSSLFALQSSRHLWPNDNFKSLIRQNLINSQQKVTPKDIEVMKSHFGDDSQLIQKYQKQLYTSNSQFSFNNKTVTVANMADPGNMDKYDRLMVEIMPTEMGEAKGKEDDTQFNFKTHYSGQELAAYVRKMFGQDHLHFQNGQFYLKFNEKLTVVHPPNTFYQYIVQSRKYPLQVDFIDLPTPLHIEQFNQKNSTQNIEDTLKLANFLNIFTKLKFLRNFEQSCPKCKNQPLETQKTMPQGYLSILARDSQMFSQTKLQYMVAKIAQATLTDDKRQKLIVALGDQYINAVRERLNQGITKEDIEKNNKSVRNIEKSLLNGFQTAANQLQPMLKKSILIELLMQSHIDDSIQKMQEIDVDMTQKYVEIYTKEKQKVSFEVLNEEGAQELTNLLNDNKCYGLQLIFGSEAEQIDSQYGQEVEKILKMVDSQTEKKQEETKIKMKGKVF